MTLLGECPERHHVSGTAFYPGSTPRALISALLALAVGLWACHPPFLNVHEGLDEVQMTVRVACVQRELCAVAQEVP